MTLSCGTKGLVVTVQMCPRNQKVLDRLEGMLLGGWQSPDSVAHVEPPEDYQNHLYEYISKKFGKGFRPVDVKWELKKLEENE